MPYMQGMPMQNMPNMQNMSMGQDMMMDNGYDQRINKLERDMKNIEDRLNRIESMINAKNNVNEYNYANQMYMV